MDDLMHKLLDFWNMTQGRELSARTTNQGKDYAVIITFVESLVAAIGSLLTGLI